MANEITSAAAHLPAGGCPHLEACPLFPKLAGIPVLNVWQTCYCLSRFESCARFTLAAQGRPVPPALLPNGNEMAEDLRLFAGV